MIMLSLAAQAVQSFGYLKNIFIKTTYHNISHKLCAFLYSQNFMEHGHYQQQESPPEVSWFLWFLVGILICPQDKSL